MNLTLLNKISNRIIQADVSLLFALKQMDSIERKLLLVFQDNNFINIISIGDIQRAIIHNHSLDTSLLKILRPNTKFCHIDDSFEEVKKKMIKYRIECMPVLNDNKELFEVYFWEDLFERNEKQQINNLKLPVVIMAGGFGTRLRPLTNVLPKPLFPVGNHTIIEEIFQRFNLFGCNEFHISLNYKADLIEYYLNNQNHSYNLNFFREEKPMGTIGSLFYLKHKLKQTFFVSNCDILISQDYSMILEYHKENNNEITLVAALKHYNIPYGTIETGNNGQLLELREKPDLIFKINSGMYILEPNLLNEIPENHFYHITDLIEKVKIRKGKVGVFPVSERSWKDIGEWSEYYKTLAPNE